MSSTIWFFTKHPSRSSDEVYTSCVLTLLNKSSFDLTYGTKLSI